MELVAAVVVIPLMNQKSWDVHQPYEKIGSFSMFAENFSSTVNHYRFIRFTIAKVQV